MKKSMLGLNRLGSSRLPAVIKMNCGKPEVLPNTLPPQFGQNPRLKVLPLSERVSYYFNLPVIFTASAGTANAGV